MDSLGLAAALVASSAAAGLLTILREFITWRAGAKQDLAVAEAEKSAFEVPEESGAVRLHRAPLDTTKLSHVIELESEPERRSPTMGRFFNLYNKQIERYQQETRSRASWSFYIAMIAMFLGFGFMFWGAQSIVMQSGADHVVAGSAIAAIGGSVSAYITKTFLDVHKLSLAQLNRYFRQPVINDHILMAQRLADELDGEARQRALERIIESVTRLIDPGADEITSDPLGSTDSKANDPKER